MVCKVCDLYFLVRFNWNCERGSIEVDMSFFLRICRENDNVAVMENPWDIDKGFHGVV